MTASSPSTRWGIVKRFGRRTVLDGAGLAVRHD
jgi:hypothetical protein